MWICDFHNHGPIKYIGDKKKMMANTPKIVSTDLVGMVTVKHKKQTCCSLVCVYSSSATYKNDILHMKPSHSWSLSPQLCLFSSASCHHSSAVYIHVMFFWWGRPVRVLVHSHHSCRRQLLVVWGSEMQAALYILSTRRWNYGLQEKGSASPAAFIGIHMFSFKAPHDNAWLSWGHLSHCRTFICSLCDSCFQHTSKFQKLYLNQADNIWRSGTFCSGSQWNEEWSERKCGR